jgi:hypothetical protein
MGRDSSVRIATRYLQDGLGIGYHGGGEIFRTRPVRPLLGHTQYPVQWVPDPSGGYSGRGW